MSETAKRFLSSLTSEQTQQAVIPFESDERMNWHYIPKERKGLPLKDMTPPQKHLASALLNAGLSQQGYIKATTIMSLEDVLRMIEKDNGVRRNPEGYFFSIFGQPSDTGTWGYRVEGHHLSLNFTLKGGKVVGSPNFLGANPAEVREGPRKGLRVLHAEEDLGRALLSSLTPEQKQTAIVTKDAYKDIITEASRTASLKGQPSGLQASKMNGNQRHCCRMCWRSTPTISHRRWRRSGWTGSKRREIICTLPGQAVRTKATRTIIACRALTF